MNALVIGASGLIGGALMRALELSGERPVGTCSTRAIKGCKIRLDVRDAHAVERCLEESHPDVLFLAVDLHGGADACEVCPDEARTVHVAGTKHVAEAAARCGAMLVYYSTDHLFDGASGPYSEEAEPAPVNAYGRVKWEAERIVRESSHRHLIIRTTTVFDWDRSSENIAMQVCRQLQAGATLRVADDQYTNPTLAEYLAEVSVRLVQTEALGVFNVAGGGRTSRAQLACMLARTMALDPSLITPMPTGGIEEPAAKPLQGGLRTEKLVETLGTQPHDLSEALRRLRRHWRADTHVANSVPTSPDAAQLKREILDKVKQYHDTVHTSSEFVPFRSKVHYAGRVFGAEEMVNLVDSSLDFWLTMGPYAEQFERKLREFVGARDAVFVTSGSVANLNAVMTLLSGQLDRPLMPGDEVITPAVTFPTTLAPIVHSGLMPVFVDCVVGTYNVDPNVLAEAVSPRTRAIMVPHTLGNPCDMDVLCEVAEHHNLFLIEDCCDALGSTFRGRLVGTFGDLATLSFYPAHHITVGEGGAVIVNRPHLARIVRSIRDWGRDCWCAPGESNTCGKRFGWQSGGLPRGYDHKFIYSNIGYNFKPTDMQAAIGVAQMERLPGFISQRKANFARLYEGLLPFQDHLVLPTLDARADPAWFGFPITVRNGLSRLELVQWLETANIETRQLMGGNILRQPAYSMIRRRVHGTLETSDRIMRETFFIGVYPGTTTDMIDFTLERFASFFSRYAH